MALLNNLAGACEATLRYMGDLQGRNYGFNLGYTNGALQAITSNYNLASVNAQQLELGDQRGKIKKARVVYAERPQVSAILTGAPALAANVCDTGLIVTEHEVDVAITKRVSTPVLKFTNTQLNELCENPQQFMDRYMLAYLRVARQAMDRDILTSLLAASGKILGHDGTTTAAGTPKSLKLIAINANGERTPLMSSFNVTQLDYTNMTLNGAPMMIGQGFLYEFFQLARWACCNSVTPFDQALAMSGSAYFLDQNANAILGNNEFLVLAPGASMLLTYNENTALGMNNEIEKHFVMPDPEIPGLSWDIDFAWDKCEKAYTWMASVHYDLFNTFQGDSFAGTDPLDGMTGIFNYVATAS